MEEKHIESFHIPSYHVDGNKNLRPSFFMAYAQEMAMNGADAIGFGYDDMARYNLAWIISRTHLEFHKPVKWKQEVEFSTWHKGIWKLFFLRDYQLKDAHSGELLVSGTSSWLALDTRERRLFRTDRLGEYFNVDAQCSDNAIEKPAEKIIVPSGLESSLEATHIVKYGDLDFIGHANNTAYLSWSMDLVPDETVLEKPLRELDINFTKETRAGERIELWRTIENTPDATVVYIEGKIGAESHFTARMVF